MNKNFNIETSKFSFCIANPPYDKGLYVDFLKKFSEISNTIISIQPINFLQKAFAFNKKIDNNIYCDDVEILPIEQASKFFDANIRTDLGIITINKRYNINDHIKRLKLFNDIDLSIQTKCFEYVKNNETLKSHLSKEITSDLILKFCDGATLFGNGKITAATFRICALNYRLACSKKPVGHTIYMNNFKDDNIRFNLYNFYNSVYIRNWVYKFLFADTNYNFLPFISFDKFNKLWNINDYKEFFINDIKLTNDEWLYWKKSSEELPS